ncbi:uncharacterized protein EV420DRAFT_1620867 [Desarmillaria tabescens]|uniref:Isomerase YbhE n=1 Tax=Armillaria tabescens TaxID=1929756 RepID=A0AA39KDQ8_ARMTA|nr:uncharacterized protein EV420DRAFT_1620867 [Desarmillaria tabescens]KAK0458070.1 hypothetical protein EV420DRAFT_1620867 [Desarmillaria tabescens]
MPQILAFATNENTEGAVQSFTVTPDGVLSEAVETVSSGGDTPAFAVGLSTGQVAVTNYASANGRIIPTTDTPLDFDDAAGIIPFPVPNGGASNPHMALEYGRGDTVWRLKEIGSPGNWSIVGSITQPTGSGPRHIAVEGDLLFTLHETTSTLTVQKIPSLSTKTAALLANVFIVPPDSPVNASFAAAELLIPKISAKFSVQYIYVSNRNMGEVDERGDTIAIFRYVEGKLELVSQVYTGLDQIQYLIAGGVAGDGSIAVFRRVDEGRSLEEVARNTDLPFRVSFVWL